MRANGYVHRFALRVKTATLSSRSDWCGIFDAGNASWNHGELPRCGAALFENKQAALTADEGRADPKQCAVRPARLVLVEQSDPRHLHSRRLGGKSLSRLGFFPDLQLDAAQVIVLARPPLAPLGP